jgi:catechol 2,3-dioxygenase-like lactoylglutathione lyase family enzyme
MRHHHVCLVVTDLDAAIQLWRDVMGFELRATAETPDGEEPGPTVFVHRALLDDIFKVKNAHTKVALLTSPDGARVELLQPLNPAVRPRHEGSESYGYAGIQEVAFEVDDIDALFNRVKQAGYAMQTDYAWPCADIGRSFLFHDGDRSLIQIWQSNASAEPSIW